MIKLLAETTKNTKCVKCKRQLKTSTTYIMEF